ncbi:MAG: hypothetical protein R3318_01830 [Gammaproteobacteria bacterium]|nr:hypothetical protein [Gammaproteobacteria bacterium]
MLFLLAALTMVTACGEEGTSSSGQSGSETSAATATASPEKKKSSGMKGVHPVLEGVKRADGVVYMDEIYKN